MKPTQIYRWLIVLTIAASCINDEDYDIDNVTLQPTLALPLVTGSLSIQDFIPDEDAENIKIANDGLISLQYQQELRAQSIRDLFEVPERGITRSFLLPSGVLPATPNDIRLDSIEQEVDLELAPEQLSEILAKDGRITYSTTIIPVFSSLQYEIEVSFPDFISTVSNQPLRTIAQGSGTLPLANHTLFLNRNKFDMKLVLVLKQRAAPVTITPGSSISIRLDFLDIDFTYIRGFFGTQTASLPADNVEINVFENSFADADISFVEPSINFTVVNDNGVPCQVTFNTLQARKGSSAITLQTNPNSPINLNFPGTLGTSATTAVTVTNTKQVLDFAPTSIVYQASATINNGVSTGNNFLADTSKLRVQMNIEVPLYGRAENIVIRDTVDIDLGDVDQSDVSSAALGLKLVNQLPLGGDIQLFLTDAQFQVLGEVLPTNQTNIVRASQVNTAGELQTEGTYDDTITLAPETINKIFDASHIIIVAVLNTTRDANGNALDVKFKADYKLSVDARILTTLKLEIE